MSHHEWMACPWCNRAYRSDKAPLCACEDEWERLFAESRRQLGPEGSPMAAEARRQHVAGETEPSYLDCTQ